MEEAIASSQIEGAATTRDVAKAMLRENRRPRTRGEQMIFNNYATISRLAGSRKRPLSLEMLLEIQASLTVDTLDDASGGGRLRTEADRVSIVDVRDETVLHTPPPARELPQRVEALCRFANGRDDTGFIHPVVRAILLHFWLAYDHPFIDGNGRTARALFYWYMLRSGYWLFEFLPISRIINRAPIKYGRAYLYSELDDCDATYFIMFNLRAIRLALHDLRKYLRHVQQERQRARELAVLFDGLNERQLQWVRQMADRPLSVSIAAYQRMHGISYATAYADLRTLTQRGLVQRRKGIGRQWLFSPSAKVKQRMRLRRAKPGPVD